MKKNRIIIILLFLSLPIGLYLVEFLEKGPVYRRYHGGDFGYFYGYLAVNASIKLNDDSTVTLKFFGNTKEQWKWHMPTKYKYSFLNFKWVKHSKGSDSGERRGKLFLDSLLLKQRDTSSKLTIDEFYRVFIGKSRDDLPKETNESIQAVYDLLIGAGKGELRPPSSHRYGIKGFRGVGHFNHYSLGKRYSYLLSIWITVWLILVITYICIRIKSREIEQENTADQAKPEPQI